MNGNTSIQSPKTRSQITVALDIIDTHSNILVNDNCNASWYHVVLGKNHTILDSF